MRRLLTTVTAATAATLLLAGPAAAHVSISPSEAPAGGYARLALRVPHGCDGAATDEVAVSIPAGVTSVKPEQVVGWDVATEVGPYDEPVVLHGEEVTEGVQVVTWTAQDGQELPDELFREFGLSLKLPDEGEVASFPVVQGCVDGSETSWIEEGEDAEHPAPALTMTAAEGDGHGHDDATAEPAADTADAEDAADDDVDAAPAALETTTDAGTDPLTVVALVVGALGLAAGVAGLTAARRAR